MVTRGGYPPSLACNVTFKSIVYKTYWVKSLSVYIARTYSYCVKELITFLGTAGSIDVFTQLRLGGFIVQVEETLIHVNPGPEALSGYRAMHLDPKMLAAAIVTDAQCEKSHDVPLLSKSVAQSLPVLSSAEKLAALSNGCEKIDVRTVKGSEKLQYGNIEVHPFLYKQGSLGVRFLLPSSTVFYTGTVGYSKELEAAAKNVAILIVSCALPRNAKKRGKMNSDDVIALNKVVKPRLTIVTDIESEFLSCDIVEEIRYIQKESGVQTMLAKDHSSVHPKSYSFGQQQKTLNKYE